MTWLPAESFPFPNDDFTLTGVSERIFHTIYEALVHSYVFFRRNHTISFLTPPFDSIEFVPVEFLRTFAFLRFLKKNRVKHSGWLLGGIFLHKLRLSQQIQCTNMLWTQYHFCGEVTRWFSCIPVIQGGLAMHLCHKQPMGPICKWIFDHSDWCYPKQMKINTGRIIL